MKDMETMVCFKNKRIKDLLGVKQSTQSFGEGKEECTLWQEKELITQHGACGRDVSARANATWRCDIQNKEDN